MANFDTQKWKAIDHAAREYMDHLPRIEQIRQDIDLLKKGLKKITEISTNDERVQARMDRERRVLQESDLPVEIALERIIARPDFQEACILDRLVSYANTVGRVVRGDGGYGTGWMIGKGLMITNNHVLPSPPLAQNAILNMGYERSVQGKLQNGHNFRLRPDLFFMTPASSTSGDEFLDFTIVGVEPVSEDGVDLAHYGYVLLDEHLGKALEGENCMVIQHPEGRYKKVVLRDIRLLVIEEAPGANLHLFYQSDTLPGSSGSMVVALGTGEVLALHNAGVPRRNAQGQYLKRDGTVYRQGDDDDDIDWVANQGVRISKIVDAFRTLPLSPAMDARRKELCREMAERDLSVVTPADMGLDGSRANAVPPRGGGPSGGQAPANYSAPVESSHVVYQSSPAGGGRTMNIIVKTGEGDAGVAFARRNILRQLPEAKIEQMSHDPGSSLFHYLDVTLPDGDPWQMAAQLEKVEGVLFAEPDLPVPTTIQPDDALEEEDVNTDLNESFRSRRADRAKKAEEEYRDLREYPNSPYTQGRDRTNPADLHQIRRWNHEAVNFNAEEIANTLDSEGILELKHIRIAQLDTGYVEHSKTKDGFDLDNDYDMIGQDRDAKDRKAGFSLLKLFRHGLRTGSLIMGNAVGTNVIASHDGNVGLVRAVLDSHPDGQGSPFAITPFRVTRHPVLLGRVKHTARAIKKAIDEGYDVITMSIGILFEPRFLFDIVREAYDKGMILCCAAGNQVKIVVAPARYPGTIAAAASNPDDKVWKGSSYGKQVDICAPGESVYVPGVERGRETMTFGDGTSYAVKHISAAAALWLAKHKADLNDTYTQGWQRVEAFRHCLRESANADQISTQKNIGAGMLDVQNLLQEPLPPASSLKHAYLDFEDRYYINTKVLALREGEYRDALRLFTNIVTGRLPYESTLRESYGGAGSMRPEAREYLSLLERETGISTASLTESGGRVDTSPEASLRRLVAAYNPENLDDLPNY